MPLDIDPLIVFYVLSAAAAILAGEAVYLLFYAKKSYHSRVNRRLVTQEKTDNREAVLMQLRRERGLTAEGAYLLPMQAFNRLVLQSGLTLGMTKLAWCIALFTATVFVGVMVYRGEVLEASAAALVSCTIVPLVVLRWKRAKRQNLFATQFPEGIDIIVRSLRAGHPVSVAINMVARELPDPVGTEFGMVADEITYGSDLETAMRAMMERVGQEDMPLFVTSIAIQASTGGNLAEILENLSKVVRERFKMRRKIKALSSEGRVSAYILTATPFIIFTNLNLVSPEFYGDVWGHPLTNYVLGGCIVWMGIGNMIMNRMINFKF
jgi:tight adherence protein B